jgi:hypothetical protein
MYLVVEMHVATGEHATAKEYCSNHADGLWVATCIGARSGISWARYCQLRKFFCLAKTLPEDVHQEGPRKGRTLSKTHMIDALQKTLQKSFTSMTDAGNSFSIDESMVPWYGNRSRTWWRILFWGLLDRVQTNTFIIFRSRAERAGSRLTHSAFYKNLTVQLFNIARARKDFDELQPISLRRNPIDYTCTSLFPPANNPHFHSEVLDIALTSSDSDTELKSVVEVFSDGQKKGRMGNQVACYYCRKLRRSRPGSVRIGRGTAQILYPKTFYGCKTCNVPLCNKYNCWTDYHNSQHVGQSDLPATAEWL